MNIQKRTDLTCGYWGLPLEIPSSASLDHVDTKELEHLQATFLELQDLLNRLKNFGNINRESFQRIYCKIRKAQALSNTFHFKELELHLHYVQFADQKQCLKLVEHCRLSSIRLKHITSNSQSISSQFSLFLQNFCKRPNITFVHPVDAYLALKTDDTTALFHILEQQDCEEDRSIRSTSLLLALLECSVQHGSIQCTEMLFFQILQKDKINVEIGNSLHRLTTSIGRMRRDPNREGHDALVFLIRKLRSIQQPALMVKDVFQRQPLHYAAFYGLSDLCQEYLVCIRESKFSKLTAIDAVLAEDVDGHTPLSLSINEGHLVVTEILIGVCEQEIGGSETAQGRNLKNHLGALLRIALYSDFDEIVHILIAHHANTNSQNVCGETALYIASRNGHDGFVRAILNPPSPQRIDIDLAENTRGWTPLFIACVEGHLSIARHLLEAGANPGLCDSFGWTPKEHAMFRGHIRVADLLVSFNSHLFSFPSHSTALEARTVVPGTVLICSQEKRQVTASELKPSGICRSRYVAKDLDSQILVTLGPSSTRSKLKAVELEDSLHPQSTSFATHIEVVGYLLEISAIGANGTNQIVVHLPKLDDMINEPWFFTARDPNKVKLLFRLFRIESYCSGTKAIVGSGIALLGSLQQGLGLKRQSLTRDYTIPILDKSTGDFVGSVTFSFLTVTSLPYAIIPSTVKHGFWKTEGFTQVVGHRGISTQNTLMTLHADENQGSGANSAERTNLQIGENTVQVNHEFVKGERETC